MAQFAKNSWINPPGPATANLSNNGPHGLSEMLYAYTSAAGNNGSAFGGINANTPYFNTTIGIAMLFGRFLMMIPLLAAAGSLAQKKLVPVSAGTFPTHGALFVGAAGGSRRDCRRPDLLPGASRWDRSWSTFLMHQGRLWS